MQKLRVKNIFISLLLMTSVTMTSCSGTGETPASSPAKLTIVTSIFPYYDFARQIVKENADVICIVPPGVEPHEYEPGTGDIKKIYSANIFIYNGLGMDAWAERLKPDLEKRGITVINISDAIPSVNLINSGENSNISDPHIWMDFQNAASALKLIYEKISLVDSLKSSIYKKNYESYNRELQDLTARYKDELGSCRIKDFISSHLAFEYLAKAANLTNHSISGISTEQEPSPKKLTELITVIKNNNLEYIYTDSLESSKFADVLAGETGAQIQNLYTLENLTRDQWNDPSITYVSLMRSNLESLKKGLQCEINPKPTQQ